MSQPMDIKQKSIKDLEFMAKKLKKRISLLEKTETHSAEEINYISHSMAILITTYRQVKREIVDISNII